MSRVAYVAAFILASSGGADAGVYEGNPSSLTLSLDAKRADLIHVEAWLDQVLLVSCAGAELIVHVEAQVDLMAGVTVEVPRGDWCAVQPLLLDVELRYAGAAAEACPDLEPTLRRAASGAPGTVFTGLVQPLGDRVLRGIYEGNPPDAR